jgi:hypothetical protein
MRTIAKTASCLMLTALYAVALDRQFIDRTMEAAQNIERDANLVSAAIKTKTIDAEDVQKKIDAMSADIAALHELVAQFEATNPQFSASESAQWKLVKDKVQLLEIFHGQKKKLAYEDFARNRSLIRAHAKGVAERAQKLQRTLAMFTPAPVS